MADKFHVSKLIKWILSGNVAALSLNVMVDNFAIYPLGWAIFFVIVHALVAYQIIEIIFKAPGKNDLTSPVD